MEYRKVCCNIRCLDQATVEAARAGLSAAPVSAVPYVCKISGQQEEVFLVSSEIAQTVSSRVAALRDPLDVLLVVATLRTQLCECDLATLAEHHESEVLTRLDRLESAGVLARSLIHGMNYYGAAAGQIREDVTAILGPYLEEL